MTVPPASLTSTVPGRGSGSRAELNRLSHLNGGYRGGYSNRGDGTRLLDIAAAIVATRPSQGAENHEMG